ncbi:MAG TPA: prepilin-type N-terminal cleavage/methylation domain-containing protein [Verrucomicrobiae bacterium]|nr:prepilin-type N-terminal cleavage/methylation domain-containing protein [Verrucomicrobiae bacterium]
MKTVSISKRGGFTLVEIMIVVAIIGLLATISIPNLMRARSSSQANVCINNLRQIESAVQQIAFVRNLADGDASITLSDVKPYLKLNSAGEIPSCPTGGTYSLLPVGQNPQSQCSLSNTVSPPHILQ